MHGLVSACLGWETRAGLARNIALRLPTFVVFLLVGLLVVAKTINIAADLAAMGEALRLVIGGHAFVYALAFGVACLVVEVFVPYHSYAGYLKFLTLVLFVYVAAAFTVEVPWSKVIGSMLVPRVSLDRDFLLMIHLRHHD
jgi:Mn2+/Fe2+ NRAMP family transporter